MINDKENNCIPRSYNVINMSKMKKYKYLPSLKNVITLQRKLLHS